jgi:hypothetical protein
MVAIASWAVLREGIGVLGTASILARQVTPGGVPYVTQPEVSRAMANSGPIAQATARMISDLSFVVFWGILVGFVTSLIGGFFGQRRTMVVSPRGTVPVMPRRAA